MKKENLHKPKWSFHFHLDFEFIHFKPVLVYQKELLWKDKFNTPRIELIPRFEFSWLGINFYGYQGDDNEWEWWVWLHKYNSGDLSVALSSWPWKPVTEEDMMKDFGFTK